MGPPDNGAGFRLHAILAHMPLPKYDGLWPSRQTRWPKFGASSAWLPLGASAAPNGLGLADYCAPVGDRCRLSWRSAAGAKAPAAALAPHQAEL